VAGGSLADRLDGTPWLPPPAARLAEALARAMHAAHRAGVIHRDLKPANILLTPDSNPKVTDFGLAKQLDAAPAQTRTGDVLGTPSYMAPEQAGGQSKTTGPAADIYSLGAILYELLTGRPPFQAATAAETLRQVAEQEPAAPRQLNAAVPRDLETVCLKCLAREPGRRYATAQELAEDLARFLAGEPIRARRTPLWELAWKRARRRPLVAALAALLLLSTALGLAGIVGSWREAAARAEAEARARERYQWLSAGLALDQGLALCDQGEGARGLLQVAETLRTAPPPAACTGPPAATWPPGGRSSAPCGPTCRTRRLSTRWPSARTARSS
jgi:hypothetical protein